MSLEVVLASTSAYRRELFSRLEIPFRAVDPNIDEESIPGESAVARASRLAGLKTEAVTPSFGLEQLVIGSDQVASIEGRILNKPGTHERAIRQLKDSSGRSVIFHTAVCLIDVRSGDRQVHVDRTEVRFRVLSEDSIERYVANDNPLDCAGSFKCECLGISLFEAIESQDPTALIGLPLIALSGMLRRCGIALP